MKRLYEPLYRVVELINVPVSWVFGSKPELVGLVESGRISHGRVIDLGCGAGLEAICLAKNGFDVTGVDFSPTAIMMARQRAESENVQVTFIQDDLTNLERVSGPFDLLLDFGALNDLDESDRDAYVRNVLPLTDSGSQLLLMCFENSLPLGEVEHRFGDYFAIEVLDKETEGVFRRTITHYMMTRRKSGS